MARILIVTYGSLGDIYPALALGRSLQERGHDAAIATSAPHRATITGAGLTFHPVRPDLSVEDEAMVRRIMNGRRGTEHLLRDLVYPSVHDMYADLAAIAGPYDVLVGSELACAVPLVAATMQRPWVYFALSPVSFLPIYDPSRLPGPKVVQWVQALGPAANRLVHRLAQAASYGWWQPVRALRQKLGLPAGRSPLFAGKYSPHLNLALFSSALQPPQPDWPRPTVQAGFLFHDAPPGAAAPLPLPPAVERFLAGGEPPIVFTLGSAAVYLADDFYAISAQAAQRLGRRALFLIGNNPPPPQLASSQLAWDYLPHADIFPRGAAIVHQGGIGTTAQALRAGRPMLIMPFAHDQFDNAHRVSRLGAGRQIARSRYTPQKAAAALAPLLTDPSYRTNAQSIADRLRHETAGATASAAIEALLRPAASPLSCHEPSP